MHNRVPVNKAGRSVIYTLLSICTAKTFEQLTENLITKCPKDWFLKNINNPVGSKPYFKPSHSNHYGAILSSKQLSRGTFEP